MYDDIFPTYEPFDKNGEPSDIERENLPTLSNAELMMLVEYNIPDIEPESEFLII